MQPVPPSLFLPVLLHCTLLLGLLALTQACPAEVCAAIEQELMAGRALDAAPVCCCLSGMLAGGVVLVSLAPHGAAPRCEKRVLAPAT